MTTTDGSARFKIKDMRTHHMCGEIVALVTTPPDYEHLLLCDGQTISADDYPELVEVLGSNVLPNLNGRVLQGGSTAGEYKEAGLPNITGQLWYSSSNYDANPVPLNPVGALTWAEPGGTGASFDYGTTKRYGFDVKLDASRSNSIYGASTTVQPPAYTVHYYICYG